MTVLSIIRDCLDALLHPSARYDALTRARHRAFMAPRLLGSLGALAAFPVYLAMRGAPTALEVAAFAWLIAPILLSWFLSRTGRYEGAHILSAMALAGLVMMVGFDFIPKDDQSEFEIAVTTPEGWSLQKTDDVFLDFNASTRLIEALTLGAYDYLTKQVGPDQILDAANGAIQHKMWALHTEPDEPECETNRIQSAEVPGNIAESPAVIRRAS